MTTHSAVAGAGTNAVQLASVRVITENLPGLVRFYEALTGVAARWLTEDFVEFTTPSATVALSHPDRVAFLGDAAPRAGANATVVIEFLVEDVDTAFGRLVDELGDGLVVLQPPAMMPWGNRSTLLHDPDGSLVNLYTPVTPEAVELQRQRQPQLPRHL